MLKTPIIPVAFRDDVVYDQQDHDPNSSIPSCFVGIDVAKAELVMARSEVDSKNTSKNITNATQVITNRKRNILQWLKTLPEGTALIVESTGTYHRLVCDLAFERGVTVYLINPQRLRAFRGAQGQRAKTDRCDAQLLLLFAQQNHEELWPYTPASPEVLRLTRLLRGRSQVVGQFASLRLSLADITNNRISKEDIPVEKAIKSVLQEFTRLIAEFDERIQKLLESHSRWNEQAQRLRKVPGLGALSTASLLAVFEKGQFRTAEAFVAFLGLDPIACDSGSKRGRRRISKKGDPMVRKTLYMAAVAAMRTNTWKLLALRYKERGLHHTQVACIIARRIAIAAWCMLKRETSFDAEKLFRKIPCPQT